ncbi:MAG: hypothetical protein M1570_06300 [Chloroflexi bacterium]|nr:hypothetical protein [Chloroflexota bacterium]
MDARLVFPDKYTLVGNLLRSTSPGFGLGSLKWMESDLSRSALRAVVMANGAAAEPTVREWAWQPDGIRAEYAVLGVTLAETKTIHDDVLLDRITVRNVNAAASTVSLVLLGEFEGRKACARQAAATALIDLSVSARTQIAIAASRIPDRACFRPYPNLIERDLVSGNGGTGEDPTRGQFLHDQIVLGWRFDLSLAAGQSSELALAITCDPVAASAAERAMRELSDPAAAFRAESESWDRYLRNEIPLFHCSDPKLEQLWLYSWCVQRMNIVYLGNRRFPWPFQVPSKHIYPHLWFWDTAFHALINRWQPDPRLAHDDLRTAALQQYPNGMIPLETYLEPGTAWGNWPDGDGQSSSVTQLPIFASAVWQVYRVTRDRALLSDLFPALVRYDDWLRRERDRDRDGLVTLVHRWEGWDTSPRWDWGMDVEPVDVNCFYCGQKRALANMADELGDRARAEHYRAEAERVAEAIRSKMWDAEAKTFFDLLGEKEIPVRVRTPAAFITLHFRVADAAQAKSLVAHLVDPNEFWSRYPIPTVALDEPTFSPRDYWRGPVWINQNWFVVDGLVRYGYTDLAAQLLKRTLDLLTQGDRPSNREYFDPLTGEGLGAIDLGWTGLCNDLIIRHVCGVGPDVSPPPTPLDIGLDRYELELPAQGIHVRFDRQAGYRRLA